ncbi:hypothetical protein SAMN02745127_02596 [Oceanospirillum multiglobuliferum]|uniref:Uncharacterized protein n=1 Tax=Oceanospirillum multiglobuliferum TaxID=64969 RepID=A0A1T4RUY2_9GAMM|nr:hypothetical protein [Oceanospirillum multiglobuliferum]OPX54611.1 hypothetical protein BTE48_13110 [Oceanospirillum multiglobuliferum]SKA19775.1 hypothetical protein SAMN02745127_02596 [Oceanospirillum multiglobuliferum]
MNNIKMPEALHEVFGETQSVVEIAGTALFATIGTLLIYFQLYRPIAQDSLWMIILGFILIADVLAGCIANFSRGTNQFYATRPKARLVFIAIHLHLLAIAWLLSAPLEYALMIWAYTIVSALIVNTLKGHPLQLFMAASLMCSGLFLLMLLPLPTWFLVTSVFFMIKVMFSFAVDHYQTEV